MLPLIKNARLNPLSPNARLLIICVGIFVAALDQTVVYGALPDMMNTIHLSVTKLDQASWIVIGYLLGYTFAMPLIGRVSDVYGHSRVYSAALLLFIVGSVLVAVSGSIEWLVGARVFQAIGGGALVPVAMAITGDMYTGKSRAVALGVIGAAVEAGGALGPFYGAVVAQYMSWQWIFWINIPVSLLVLVVIRLYMPKTGGSGGRVDYVSGILLAAALAFLCVGVSRQKDSAGYLPILLSCLAVAAVLFALFILRARRTKEPLIALSVFKNTLFSASTLTNLFVGGALIIAMVDIPLMSDTILGCTPLEGGLRLLRFTVLLSVGALFGGFLCKRFGYRIPTLVGLLFSAAGFIFMSRWTLTIGDPAMTLHLGLCGFGFGLVIAPLGTAALDAVGEDQKGLASSTVVMARMIGMMLGMSAITAWGMERFHLMTATLTLQDLIESPEKLTGSLLTLFNNFFFTSVILCIIALVPAFFLFRKKKKVEGTAAD